GKTGKPYPERDEIAQRQEPQTAINGAIMYDACANFKSDSRTECSCGSKSAPGPPGQRREQDRKNRPGQAERKQQSHVAKAAGVARAARPAHLVLKEFAEAVRGQMGFYNDIRQHNFVTGFRNAITEFKIIGE